MSFNFDIERVIQLVAFLINESGGRAIDEDRLLSYLYLCDRESLREFGFPLTGDEYLASQHGPVPLRTHNIVLAGGRGRERWDKHFIKEGQKVGVLGYTPCDMLSDSDKERVHSVVRKYCSWYQQELDALTQEFEECKKNPSTLVPLRDILIAIGRGKDVEAIEQSQRESKYLAELFGSNENK